MAVESAIVDRVEFQMLERAKRLAPVKDAVKGVPFSVTVVKVLLTVCYLFVRSC